MDTLHSNTQKVVTRFAPSPTGLFHSGSYRTAVFSYLYAKKYNGEFILRIEDTDKERSTKEYEENIIESLKWLDLPHDHFYRQSDNVARHKEVLLQMIADDKAYISKEEPKVEGGRTEVIRFRNPNRVVTFHDIIRGDISFDTTELKDFVIAKSFDEPLFHLAVVVDDFDEGVTHIIRGEDHISNTPRQILIQEAIGAATPMYAHLPLVLAADRTKLSKRKGALSMTEYRKKGYEAAALLNYMSLIGWNPGTDREYFTKDELIVEFDLARVQKSGAIFDDVKLQSINRHYLLELSDEEFEKRTKEFLPESITSLPTFNTRKEKFFKNLRERISYFGEVTTLSDLGEFDYFFSDPVYAVEQLLCSEKMRKNVVITMSDISTYLSGVVEVLENLNNEAFDHSETVKEALMPYADSLHRGGVLWATRMALSGKEKSPDPFTLISLFGKDDSITRLKAAVAKI